MTASPPGPMATVGLAPAFLAPVGDAREGHHGQRGQQRGGGHPYHPAAHGPELGPFGPQQVREVVAPGPLARPVRRDGPDGGSVRGPQS